MWPISRFSFLFCGLLLLTVKIAIDSVVSSLFGHPWSAMIYWSPTNLHILYLPPAERNFALALAGVSLPFTALGNWLTARRLKTLQLGLWLSILFFIPAVNLVFFAFLVASSESDIPRDQTSPGPRSPLFGKDSFNSLFASAGVSALCACVSVALAIKAFQSCGWGVFLAIPFGVGVLTTILVSIPGSRTFGYCFSTSLLSLALTGITLILTTFEGLACLVLCIPIAIPLAALGVAVGREIASPHMRHTSRQSIIVAASLLALCPLYAGIEQWANPESELFAVVTSVEINAPAQKVWQNVIAFPELPAPTEPLFHLGIAYPVRARIEGKGKGAIRYCEFSTGPFCRANHKLART